MHTHTPTYTELIHTDNRLMVARGGGGGAGWKKWLKRVKRYKLPVIK